MTLEQATPDHAAAIALLEGVCMPVPWSEAALQSTLSLPTTRAWLLSSAGTAIGYLLTTEVLDTAEVLTVGVHPDHRRQGHARRLLGAAMLRWRSEQVVEAFLDVRDGNHAAQGLYEVLGFTVVGRRPQMYADGTDAVLMRWTP